VRAFNFPVPGADKTNLGTSVNFQMIEPDIAANGTEIRLFSRYKLTVCSTVPIITGVWMPSGAHGNDDAPVHPLSQVRRPNENAPS
jgi:hypothetical protein